MSLVTLLTDFGTGDSYVAEVKGALLRLAPGLTLVDVTHAVPPGDVRALTTALNQLLGNPGRRAEMAAAARSRVTAEFTQVLMGERAASLLERLATGKGMLM